VVTVLVLYLGPWRVAGNWAAMHTRANTEVTDTVDFAIRAYESQHGMYDTSQSHMVPRVDGDAAFFPPAMSFSMPQKVRFKGKTNQGNYTGTWDTATGEIVADIETGGYTVGGMVDVKQATGTFQMTGREKNGVVTAEADGQDLKVIVTKHEKN
jgi:hypothetical protein